MFTGEQFDTCSKKGRGMAQKSLDLVNAMVAIAKDAQPITGRGVGYKLFTSGLIPSMSRSEMQRVYRLMIKWNWIVDETRGIERISRLKIVKVAGKDSVS